MDKKESEHSGMWALTIGALGVVYGDIGTSPLYALRECFTGSHAIDPDRTNVFGVLSLIFWSLTLLVSIKYLAFVMRANNRGEGGILSLLALALPERGKRDRRPFLLVAAGIFGATLLYGDGIITPAVTVLGAIEGLNVATPMFQDYILPITVVILIGLFSFQRVGTGAVGSIFGPVTVVWFVVMLILGIRGIVLRPEVLLSINPWNAVQFFMQNGWHGFAVLGTVFLVVTGAEALYADMGHFGIKPIRRAWFGLVFPALFINYLGQGALLLHNPQAISNPFYQLAPGWALFPLVGLATMAAIIASQALISGAFSITMQAIQLGYLPRLEIRHTSSSKMGQIYIPQVNRLLMIACIGLVVGFQSSSNLAGAYGIAVSLTMLITMVLLYVAARRVWRWSAWKAGLLCALFLPLELVFAGANLLKIPHGGWFPLVMGLSIFAVMTTWKNGRRLLRQKMQGGTIPFHMFVEEATRNSPHRVSGTAVFMAGNRSGTPLALLHNLKHNKILHERTIVLTIETDEVPHVAPSERIEIERIQMGFFRIVGHYGFMEEPDVPKLMGECAAHGLEIKPMETTFFLSRETIIPTRNPGMALWRESLFALMSRNAQTATSFFRLPPNRVVELGMQVEM